MGCSSDLENDTINYEQRNEEIGNFQVNFRIRITNENFRDRLDLCSRKNISDERTTILKQLISISSDITSINTIINPNMYYLIDMIKSNLFPLYESKPLEPNNKWKNMELIYKLLLKIISNKQCEEKAFKYIAFYFTNDLINLFNTEVNNERDIIKLILYKIYEKKVRIRNVIRIQIFEYLDQFIKNENDIKYGISELLEIMSNIIYGLKTNIKEEYINFFNKIIIPLHKNEKIDSFFDLLNKCTMNYIEKGKKLVYPLLDTILNNWPFNSHIEEKLFLKELSDIMDYVDCSSMKSFINNLFIIVIKCLSCSNKEIFFRTKELINKKIFVELLFKYDDLSYKIILPGVFYLSQNHQDEEAKKGFLEIAKIFENNNSGLFEKYKNYKDNENNFNLEVKWVKEEINENKKSILKKSFLVKVEEEDDEEENYFGICPITQEIMKKPVKAPSGFYYEENAIFKWLEKHNNDPLTRQYLNKNMLVEDKEYNKKLIEYKKKKGISISESDSSEGPDELDRFIGSS